MKRKLAAVGCTMIALAVYIALSTIVRAQTIEVPAPIAEAFCLGWSQAIEAEQKRYANWKSLVVGNSTPTTAFGIALRAVADSIPPLVLLPELGGKLTLADGRTFDCGPKPPALPPVVAPPAATPAPAVPSEPEPK